MQQRVLHRAGGLGAFRRALVGLARVGRPLDARRRVVIVPTHASGELLRQTIEESATAGGERSIVVPDFLTRSEWISRLHVALPGAPPLLSRVERELLLEGCARRTAVIHPGGSGLFELRPGLVAAMLDFYDELRRRQRSVRRAVAALFDELGVERGTDRGSESLILQTCFLGSTFLAYERGLVEARGIDEHGVRLALVERQPTLPFDHLIIAVADHPSDPRGLWPADFDLIGRLIRLARIDVVVTDEAHDAGFRERLEQELPGIEETRAPAVPRSPVVVTPPGLTTQPPVFVYRDREEEMRAVAREVRAVAESTDGRLQRSVAVVFQRPLPYLYLAQQVLNDARVPYQTFDALPLAAEPYAALLDVTLTFARTGGTREAAVALLRSPLLSFHVEGEPLGPSEVAALDGLLAERRVTGDASTYPDIVQAHFERPPDGRRVSERAARRAAQAAAAAYDLVAPFRTGTVASQQLRALAALLRRHERVPHSGETWRERHLRARSAVLAVLDELAAACQRFDDRARHPEALTALIHHAVEARTFTPRRGAPGVHLVDAVAARFGEFDQVHVVGLVETDWPERMKRGIFYSATLLKALGWPQESDQMRAQQAAFRDLMGLAADSTRLSAFQLEGDAVVALSPMVERVRDLPSSEAVPRDVRPVFADELLTSDLVPMGLEPEVARWLDARKDRPDLSDRAYGGFVNTQPRRPYRVSSVDRYVECPFKYFSERVLQLAEEREEASGMTPLERGTLLHSLFERFYRAWQDEGRGAITPETLPEALTRFAALTREWLERLPEADRTLEETRLLGSIVGMGVAERVFELEADSGAEVRERWLECDLTGPFSFPVLNGLDRRVIEIRGKADRIDILADGSLRVVDYKLGKLPDVRSSVQIAVYAHAARQRLEAQDGRSHPITAAMYLAFGDDRRLEGALGSSTEPVAIAVEVRAGEFAAAIDRIESGEFPPRPKRPGDCQWCPYAGVCRKEYLAEDDDATDVV